MRNILNVNKVLDKTYDFYRQHMKSLIGFTALMTLITTSIMYGVILVVGLIFAVIFGIGFAVLGTPGPETYGWIVLIIVIAVIVMVPAMSIVEMVAAGPICALEIDAEGGKVTFGTMMNYSFKKIWYIITSTMACTLGYLLICAVGGGIYYLLYVVALSQMVLVAQIILSSLFGLILLVPLLWYGVITSMFLPVALCEKRHFFGAVIGSYHLVKGQFKRILGMLFSYSLSFTIIYSSLGGLSSVLINFLTGIF
ncbi:MAG: hypothetical protein H7X94_15590, partial [Vallitaleaceae bacterium]|nr:hypothetical protein [Vallitaleaceae bacterium]